MAPRRWLKATSSRQLYSSHASLQWGRRTRYSTMKASDDLEEMLVKPSWSVKSLFQPDGSIDSGPAVTQKELHHLLRLSALPLPSSEAQEAKMIRDLRMQLKFVQAIQQVNTEDVEPLQSIRDETGEGLNSVTIDCLLEEFDKEEVVGRRGRIRKKDEPPIDKEGETRDWDPLAQAPKKLGRYFIVDTAKD